MKAHKIMSVLCILATWFVFIFLISSLLFASITPLICVEAAIWSGFILAINFAIAQLIQRKRTNLFQRFALSFCALVLLAIAVFATIRFGAFLLGTETAWSRVLIYVFATILLSAGLQYIFHLFEQRKHHTEELRGKLVQKQQELDLLTMQTNPHYLFNTLNNLSATVMYDRDMALDYIYKLSEMFRYQEKIAKNDTISLDEEIMMIHSFLEIEKFRLGPRCAIHFQYNLEQNDIQVPPLFLYPFVSAVVSTGIKVNSKLSLQMILEGRKSRILLTLRNDDPVESGKSIFDENALLPVIHRLELLYGRRLTFEYSPQHDGKEVILAISMDKKR